VLFFLSYMGFGLITNVGENMRNAKQTIPRAIYTSIGIAVFVYVAVAVVAVGNLPLSRLTEVGENALAVAAEPFLGSFGFLLISIGALFSIASALNATLYGGANIAYALAKDGELPEFFEHKVWFGSMEGLYITAALSIGFALLFDMNGIAAITSSVFTVIYIFVLLSHYRLAHEVGGNRLVLVLNVAVLIAVLGALLYYQGRDNPATLLAVLAVLVAAVVVEAVHRYGRNREFRSPRVVDETKVG
jgi:amino acid transporter